jgi:hypothetical protein
VIIQVEGASAEVVAEVKRSLAELVKDWDVEIAEVAPTEAEVPARGEGYRGVDPVALVSLIVSLPSAALAVGDLADRIKKRKRAKDLIDRTVVYSDKRVTAVVITETRTVELRTLTPDQLIELAADKGDA